jgi:L-asparaginase
MQGLLGRDRVIFKKYCLNEQWLYFYPVFKGLQVAAKKIVMLGMGGTIAGAASSASNHTSYKAGQIGLEQLVEAVPALRESAQTYDLLVEEVARIDSKDMDFAILARLAQRVAQLLAQDDVQAVVITHGTDTLEETAFFLQALLGPAKPVVLTCAMRPATALVPDGPQNMLDALAVACHHAAQGVVAVCAGVIHGAQDVRKVHPYRLDAFSSGDAGPIGFVEEGRLRLVRNWPAAKGLAGVASLEAVQAASAWPYVEIVLSHAGADGRLIDALVRSGVQGLVVAGTGNGTVHEARLKALLQAQAQGIPVFLSTRCPLGQLLKRDNEALTTVCDLSPVQARIALMLHLLSR